MLTHRQEQLITKIVQKYIRLAEPISSKNLEKSGFFGLSSATIRAEMNELERAGYLTHLHRSGGRVPTDTGYRYFVNRLEFPISNYQFPKYEVRIKNAIMKTRNNPKEINKAVGKILSDLSENLVITSIEEEGEFFKTGLASLFEMPEFREFDRIFRITNFFDEFEKTFAELERAFFGDFSGRQPKQQRSQPEQSNNDVKVFIGRENPIKDMRDETVMFARYNLPQGYSGSLTLIGPTRMDYAKNIGLIKCATCELNKISRAA